MTTPEELDRLLAIARAATPGPWSAKTIGCDDDLRIVVLADSDDGEHLCEMRCEHMEDEETATHIATFSPDVVIALLEELRAARGSKESL